MTQFERCECQHEFCNNWFTRPIGTKKLKFCSIQCGKKYHSLQYIRKIRAQKQKMTKERPKHRGRYVKYHLKKQAKQDYERQQFIERAQTAISRTLNYYYTNDITSIPTTQITFPVL